MATSPSRRRERSVRVTTAALLLAAATAVSVGAIVVGSLILLSAAAAFSVVAGWTSLRITFTELLASRRETGQVRAGLSREYRELFDERAEENATILHALTGQMVRRERELSELNGVIRLAERRAELAEEELREIKARFPEQLAHDDSDDMVDTVVDLLGWGRTSTAGDKAIRRHA